MTVPETEYMAFKEARLLDLQRKIARSGLSISQIAKGTRMKWSTVDRAAQGLPVRMEVACRIEYFIKKVVEQNMKD